MSTLIPEPVPAFFLNVDGKRYGPFFNQNDEKVNNLMHMKGVTVDHVMMNAPKEKKVKKKKAVHPSLLDGIDWYPVGKR